MQDTVTSKAVALGLVEPKPIENGVLVPPGLQVNCLTIDEKQAAVAQRGQRALDADEIQAVFANEIRRGIA